MHQEGAPKIEKDLSSSVYSFQIDMHEYGMLPHATISKESKLLIEEHPTHMTGIISTGQVRLGQARIEFNPVEYGCTKQKYLDIHCE